MTPGGRAESGTGHCVPQGSDFQGYNYFLDHYCVYCVDFFLSPFQCFSEFRPSIACFSGLSGLFFFFFFFLPNSLFYFLCKVSLCGCVFVKSDKSIELNEF